jgi:hypothetical protein
VELETDNVTVARIGFDMTSGETADLTGLNPEQESATMSAIASDPGSSMEPTAQRAVIGFTREINSPYRETMNFPIYYGDRSEGGFNTRTTNSFQTQLGQKNAQGVLLSWTQMDNRLVAPTVGASLMHQTPPVEDLDDFVSFGNGSGLNFVYRTQYTDTGSVLTAGTDKKYNISLDSYLIYDWAAAVGGHRFDFYGVGDGFRWWCVRSQVCEFPSGHEAPVI